MSSFFRDLRGGLRLILQHPGFSLVAIFTLALGVGVSSSVFSVVNGSLINPTPWRDVEQVVFLWDQDRDQPTVTRPLSYARFLDVKAQSRSFAQLVASRSYGFVLTDTESAESVSGAFVSPEAFAMLGIGIELGRPLREEDTRPDAERVIVLDHAIWERRYGADPGIVGRQIELERQTWTVVGVLDSTSWFPFPGNSILAPIRPDAPTISDRNQRTYAVIGRLDPTATPESVRAELALISQRLTAEYPTTDDARWPLRTQSVGEVVIGGPARAGVLALAGALGFLLLIACANLTGLFITRSTARRREIAVRATVGASPGQIVAQLLTENMVLAFVAVPVALLVTRGTLGYIYTQVPPQVTGFEQTLRFDLPVWLFAIVASLGTVFVFGLTPALQASRIDLMRTLKEGGDRGASGGSQWLGSTLVVAQLALSVVLLVGSALLNQSFLGIVGAQPGFDMEKLFYAPVGIPNTRYPEPAQRIALIDRITEQLARIPGVAAVGVSDSAVSAGAGPIRSFEIASKRAESTRDKPQARWTAGSPGFLQALGLKVVAGRSLESTDDAQGRRVAVVSELFARTHFAPGESALGQLIVMEGGSEIEIVGVVQNVKQIGLNATQRPQVYVPYAQEPSPFVQVVARTTVDPLSIGPNVRAQIEQIDPLIPVLRLTTALRERALANWPIGMFSAVLGLLGVVGLLMATVGVYSVVHYSTLRRLRELGIRAALGADPVHLVLLVLRRTWWLSGLGLAIGIALAILLGPVLRSLLYEVSPFQPAVLLLPAVLLTASSLVAGTVPAALAARVDPVVALAAD